MKAPVGMDDISNLSPKGQKLWTKGASYFPRTKKAHPSVLKTPHKGLKKANAAGASVKGKSNPFYPRAKK